MRKLGLAAFAVFAVGLTSGCATITKGTSQTVTVATDPSGAACTLTRDAKALAVINSTPGSIPISKDSGTITVICKKADYQDAAGTMASQFQAMTFGNILFGGLIGVAVDAASGAMNEYPPMVTITLIPDEFRSNDERDTFFERMRQSLLTEAAEVKERIAKKCVKSQCETELAAADEATRVKLGEIEQKRIQARVAGG